MTSHSQRKIRLVWEMKPDTGWEDEYYDGILVREYGALYRLEEGNACLALVAPTATDGLYRIDGPDLTLITRDPLEDVARLLNEMSTMDFLLKVMPKVMLPDEMLI
ncbi:hypothetical protein NYE27_21210 [Paenibacillus sp. FSL R10-2779]|uniref:hypothetical protein n=1 Tax=Paenibacillus sp. FSL R10-2779 TaxID=2975340 RepID=UPI0030FB9922